MADLDFQSVVARTAEYVDQQNRRVAELEKALRAAHACCCSKCAVDIEKLLPDTHVPT